MNIKEIVKIITVVLILASGFSEAGERAASFPFQRAQGVLITLSEYSQPLHGITRTGGGDEYMAMMPVPDFDMWRRGLRLEVMDSMIAHVTPWESQVIDGQKGYRTILLIMDESGDLWYMSVDYVNGVGAVILLREDSV